MDAQQIASLLLVGAAAGSLGLRAYRRFRAGGTSSHCAGCGECGRPAPPPSVRPAPQPTPLVTLGAPGQPRPRFKPPTPE